MNLVLVSLAGALGALARYGIEEIVELRRVSWRPYGTMAVNALGCFIAVVGGGAIVHFFFARGWEQQIDLAHTILVTGFCGGFTTFSSALAIPLLEWRRGGRIRPLIILLGTPLLCALAPAAGAVLAFPPFPA